MVVMAGLATLCALPSAADVAGMKRGPSIAACLTAAPTIEALRACKRMVFKPCVKEPEHMQSTQGLVMCNLREGDQWNELLKARTGEFKARDKYRAEALAAADAAWRAWVEVECDFHRAEAMGGSAEQVITAECHSDLAADRVISLTWQLRGNVPY
jgi:uncharacterized protein YecT (DUF1311 family)